MTRHLLLWTLALAWALWTARDPIRREWRLYRRGREALQQSASDLAARARRAGGA